MAMWVQRSNQSSDTVAEEHGDEASTCGVQGLFGFLLGFPSLLSNFFSSCNYILNIFTIVAILFVFCFTYYLRALWLELIHGFPQWDIQSFSLLPIIRAITPFNKITAKFKSTKRRSTWTNESCWRLQTLQLFDHHKKKAVKCASYLKVCHTQPDTEVVLLHSGRRDFFRPQGDRGPGGVGLHCPRPGQPGWGSACCGGPSTQMSAHSERTLESEGKKRERKKKGKPGSLR